MNTYILHLINGWAGKNDTLDNLMIFSADYLIYLLFFVALMCVCYLAFRKQWREVIFFFVALGVSFIILYILAHVFISQRPFVGRDVTQLIEHAADQSFPSDHVTASMTIALALLAFTRFKVLGWILVASAVLIGFARIFAGLHYPLDVAGGIITALAGMAVTLKIRALLSKKYPIAFAPTIETESDTRD